MNSAGKIERIMGIGSSSACRQICRKDSGEDLISVIWTICAGHNDTVVHYALGGLKNKVLATQYKLQLADENRIKAEFQLIINLLDLSPAEMSTC
jgi:hypothetical protein